MLDLRLQREIIRMRARYRLSQDEFHGLYTSDRQVDALLSADSALHGQPGVEALTSEVNTARQESRRYLNETTRWSRIVERFALTPAEQDIPLLALAPRGQSEVRNSVRLPPE